MPELSAVVVVGPRRERSQRALDALCAQTAIDQIEILVIDLAPAGTPPLAVPPRVRVTYLERKFDEPMAAGRFEGFKHATSPIVAFIEDHAIPRADWAEALINAYEGPWAAIGYAFENANPDTYLSRACMVNDYGQWMAPVSPGETRFLAGHNVSYRRDTVMAFGDRLQELLTPDLLLHQALRAKGERLCVAPDAVVAHENFTRFLDAVRADFSYMKMLSAARARAGGWSIVRRLSYSAAVLAAAPIIGLWRLYGGLRGRGALVPVFLAVLPICVALRVVAGIGESLGYLTGSGKTPRRVHYWESTAIRDGR